MTSLTASRAPALSAVRRSRRIRWVRAGVLCLVLVAVMVASVRIGTRAVEWSDVAAAVRGSVDTFEQAAIAKRIPRTLLAVLAGGALAVSGAVMQGVTRNPLADPSILGVTTGASLAVAVGVAFLGLVSATGFIWFALTGASLTAVFVYLIGSLGRGGATPLKLTLAGAATSSALVSVTTAVVLPRNDIAGGIRSWQIGGVGGGTSDSIRQVLPFLLVGFLLCVASARALNTLALGEDLAAGLGERVAVVRLVSAAGAVVLCGAATAVTGPIGFVGLVVPHACRLLVGTDHRWLLPFSALGGAVLLTAGDVVGRIVARPSELDVGIVTAIVGAPFFIAIVRRQKMRAL